MSDQMKKALGDILAMLADDVKALDQQAHTQVPLLVQEYIKWGLYQCWFWIAIGVIIGVAGLLVGRMLKRHAPNMTDYDDRDFVAFIGWAMQFVGPVLGFFFIASNAFSAIQIIVAPRVYLLQEVTRLIKLGN